MGRPWGPERTPATRRILPFAIVLLLFLLLFAGVADILLTRAAKELIERAFGEGASLARIEVVSPGRVRLSGFELPGLSAREILIDFSLTKTITQGLWAGLASVEAVGLRLDLQGSQAGAEAHAFPALPPAVRILDGALVSGGESLVDGVVATLERSGDGYRFELREAQWRPAGAALAAEGELRFPEEGSLLQAAGKGAVRGLTLGGLEVVEAEFGFSFSYRDAATAGGWNADIALGRGSGSLYGLPFASLAAEASGGPAGWTIHRLEAEADGGAVHGRGRIETAAGLQFHLSMEGNEVPARHGLAWLTRDASLLAATTGTIDGALQFTGTPSAFAVRGVLESPWIRIHDAFFTALSGEFERTPAGAVRARAEAEAGGGAVRLEGFVWSPERAAGTLTFEGVAAPSLVRAVSAFAGSRAAFLTRLSGRANGRLELGGRPGAVEVGIRLDSDRLRWGGVPLEPIAAQARWSGREWALESVSALIGEDGPLLWGWAAGRVEDVEGSVSFRNLPVEWIRRLAGLPFLPGLAGEAGGVLRFARRGEGFEWNGEAAVMGQVAGTSIEGQVAAGSGEAGAWAARGEIRAGSGRATFSGSGSPSGLSEVEGSVEQFPAGVVAGLWGTGSLSGLLDGGGMWRREGGSWSLRGHITSDELRAGGIRLARAGVRFDVGPEQPGGGSLPACPSCLFGTGRVWTDLALGDEATGEPVELVAAFLGDRVELNPASLRLGGGNVTLGGWAQLVEGEWRVELSSAGRGITLRRDGLALSDLSYRLDLGGPLRRLWLTGDVEAVRGELDLFRLGKRPAASGSIPVELGVNLRVQGFRVQARSLLDTELSGVLALRGTASNPALQGELSARRTSFWYLGSRFSAAEGSLTFAGTGLIPRVAVTGELRRPGRTVYARVEGPADSLEVSLSADPPLGERELLELVGVPTQWSFDQEGGWGGLAAALATWVDRELVSDVYWRLGSALEKRFDLDAFRIEPSEEGGTRLLLGKYVSPGLYVSYGWELSNPGTGEVGVEYALSPYLRLRSGWSREHGTEVGVAATVPF